MQELGPCRHIQLEVDRLEQVVSALQEIHDDLPPPFRPRLRDPINRIRQQLQQERAELRSCLRDPSCYTPRLGGIEVTQAIQDMSHSVTLIADKRTVVRAYLRPPSLGPAVTARAELALWRSPSGPRVTIPSLNTVLLDPDQIQQLDDKRRNTLHSLNFLLPADHTTAGPLYIGLASLTDADTASAFDVGLNNLNTTRTVTFTTSAPLRIRILGVRYQFGSPPVTHVPSTLDFELANSWLRRAYPVAQVISTQAIVDATATPPFDCGQINAQVAAIRALDVTAGADRRTHYYGLVSDGGFFMRGCAAVPWSTPDPSAVGSGPTGPATWGWDFDGSYGDWYTGHELGHTFGRLHPGSGCGESSDDPNYPFPNGQLADADDAFVGLDSGDSAHNLAMAALPGTDWHDVMTYCDNQWLSSYTYEGIRARLVNEDSLPPGPSPGPGTGGNSMGRPDERFPEERAAEERAAQRLISVVGTVNLTKGEGKIEYVNPLPEGQPSRSAPDSPVTLRITRADGQVLHEYSVGVNPLSCTPPGQDRLALLDAVLAVHPDARVIEMSVAGNVVDAFRAGATSPDVRGLRQTDAEGNQLSLAWETGAEAEGESTYSVQVSTDEGRTWQTLAVGLPTPDVAIDRDQFRGAGNVLVRVIATDGFRRSVVTSEPLSIDAGQAP